MLEETGEKRGIPSLDLQQFPRHFKSVALSHRCSKQGVNEPNRGHDVIDDEPVLKELAEAIKRIVQASFEERKKVVFLSTLGQILNKEGIQFKSILGDVRLAEFIRSNLSDSIALETDPNYKKVVAAYPISAELDKIEDPFGLRAREERTSTRPVRPQRGRIRDEIWRAFNTKIPDGHRRFIRLNGEIDVLDTPDDAPAGFVEIPDRYVFDNSPQSAGRVDATYDNTLKWCEENALDFDSLLVRTHTEKTSRSLLDLLISNLSHEEASKLVMPLSIVAKLRAARP